ncbi:hypothetical protein E2320_020400 [Naja naja]|nr:hypothetical protein E2320_020400 [Naja naja]
MFCTICQISIPVKMAKPRETCLSGLGFFSSLITKGTDIPLVYMHRFIQFKMEVIRILAAYRLIRLESY